MKYAGFWRRAAAFVVDWLVIVAATILLMSVVAFASSVWPQHPQGLDYLVGALLGILVLSSVLAIIGVIVLYFPIQEARFGQTLGKRWLGLYVLKESGLPIGYKEAFLRRLSFYFDFVAIDALFIPFTANKQRAFDIIAHTVVIKD
ncbi:MAG: RDD family protein [Anaerolineae bacterium]